MPILSASKNGTASIDGDIARDDDTPIDTFCSKSPFAF